MSLLGFESSLCCAIRDNNLNLLSDILHSNDEARQALKERTHWERKTLSWSYFVYHAMARKGFSPMHIAAGHERTEIMRILVQDYKALVDPLAVGGEDDWWTPLHEAVRQDKPESVRMLISLGADIEKLGKWGSELGGSPVQWARKLGHDECIQIIMKMEIEKRTENELSLALDIQSKLYENDKNLDEKDRRFNIKMYELEQEKERLVSDHERFKCQHAEESQRLIMSSEYRTEAQIVALTEEVSSFSRLHVSASQASSPATSPSAPTSKKSTSECPVCLEEFRSGGQIFSCQGCDGLLCSACVPQVTRCPLCRLNFGPRNKPVRNKAVERILMIN